MPPISFNFSQYLCLVSLQSIVKYKQAMPPVLFATQYIWPCGNGCYELASDPAQAE